MPVQVTVKAILSDMDGTLLDSTPGVTAVFTKYCSEQGIDAADYLSKSHGRRIVDVIRQVQKYPKPGSEMSEEELHLEARRLEDEIITTADKMAKAGGEGIIQLPGVGKLLQKLREGGARWAIVTSATGDYARQAQALCGIAPPPLLACISGDMCTHGKPHPEPYLTGLAALNALPTPPSVASAHSATPLRPEDVLVLEDAPAGIESGLNAGCLTLGVCTSQPVEVIKGTRSTYKVLNLNRVEVVSASWEEITLSITTLDEEVQ